MIRNLVFAASDRGDVVVDPFSGSGTTLVVAEQSGRRWLGCELCSDYNKWAIQRFQAVTQRSDEEWIAYDRKVEARRQRIRQT